MKKRSYSNNKTKGFTFVEVIVVLVVLAVIAAILIPSFIKHIDKAQSKAAISECRSCVLATQVILTENYKDKGKNQMSKTAVEELAEVAGDFLYSTTGDDNNYKVQHLSYQTKSKDIVVSYCADRGNCGQNCNNTGKNEVYVTSDKVEALGTNIKIAMSFNQILDNLYDKNNEYILEYLLKGRFLNSSAIDESVPEDKMNRITKLYYKLDEETKSILKGKTWQLRNTDHGVRIFFTNQVADGKNLRTYKYDPIKGYQFNDMGKVKDGVLEPNGTKWGTDGKNNGWTANPDGIDKNN
ncbi:MAG: prepilin-type N-terminal cleavage/methylation domain-containing protein [Anaerovoracaceae bacterium]